MIFAGLLAPRKKLPVWRVGSAQAWMRGHLWLGLLSLPLILFHGGFRFGGPLTTAIMILLIIVVASGLFGAALQHYIPNVMTLEVPLETIFEQIERRRSQLLAEADEIVRDRIFSRRPAGFGGRARCILDRRHRSRCRGRCFAAHQLLRPRNAALPSESS